MSIATKSTLAVAVAAALVGVSNNAKADCVEDKKEECRQTYNSEATRCEKERQDRDKACGNDSYCRMESNSTEAVCLSNAEADQTSCEYVGELNCEWCWGMCGS
jgi:hypothetical protein